MYSHIVTPGNRAAYSAQLEEMHRVRHEIFVNSRGWRSLDKEDGLERDEFDSEDAVYLLVINDVGGLEASLRLTPTSCPHLLQGLAEEWKITQPPTGHGVWEWSRYLPGCAGAGRQRLAHSRSVLITGALEFARSRGIHTFTACADIKRLNMFTELGWRLEFLSDIIDYGGGRGAAIKWPVGQDELDFARAHFGLDRPVSIEMPACSREDGLHYLHFALTSELWTIDDPDILMEVMLNLSRNAARTGRVRSAQERSDMLSLAVKGGDHGLH